MPTYNVHIYREMRILYQDIKADTPEAAAESCRDFPSDAGCDPVDCDGQTFAAVVDVQNTNHSKDILFDEGRLRLAALELLEACELLDRAYADGEESGGLVSWDALDDAWAKANAAIAKVRGGA